MSFLQFSLNLCLLQGKGDREVLPRVERLKATIRVAGIHDVGAEDDGGICRMDRHAHGWMMGHRNLAFIETKMAFSYIHFDEQTGEH